MPMVIKMPVSSPHKHARTDTLSSCRRVCTRSHHLLVVGTQTARDPQTMNLLHALPTWTWAAASSSFSGGVLPS